MKNVKLDTLLKDHFGDNQEVLDVVMYALASININDAVTISKMIKSKEVRGISPDAYSIMKRFDNGLVKNNFWLENFAPIKLSLAMTDIKHRTQTDHLTWAEEQPKGSTGVAEAARAARASMLTRCDVFTLIAFLWRGYEFAQEFDARFRMMFQLAPEHEQYFKELGA